jgi:NAD(P)H dehydrogenase (quinone)
MNVLVIYCHPLADSFNHALALRVVETLEALEHRVLFHDLYSERFDPLLDEAELRRGISLDEQVLRHVRELESSDALVIIHPDWWSQPPAILKGWIDRVLRAGVAYEFEGPEFMKRQKKPLLQGKKALVFATSHGSREDRLLEKLWSEGVFRFCGLKDGSCHVLRELRDLNRSARLAWLEQVAEILKQALPPAPPTPPGSENARA